jgi:hypothetical protein
VRSAGDGTEGAGGRSVRFAGFFLARFGRWTFGSVVSRRTPRIVAVLWVIILRL